MSGFKHNKHLCRCYDIFDRDGVKYYGITEAVGVSRSWNQVNKEDLLEYIKGNEIFKPVILNLDYIDGDFRSIKTAPDDAVYLDRELISKINEPRHLSFRSNIRDLDSTLNKAVLMGFKTSKLTSEIYILRKDNYIRLISEKQICLPYSCDRLFFETDFKSIDFEDVNTDEIIEINQMFWDCKASRLNVKNFNTSHVFSMNGVFTNCSLKELDLNSWNTERLMFAGGMFEGCKIRRLNLSNFNTSEVIYAPIMFRECNIGTLIINSFTAKNVENAVEMFSGSKIDQLLFMNFDFKNVEIYRDLFKNAEIGEAWIKGIPGFKLPELTKGAKIGRFHFS